VRGYDSGMDELRTQLTEPVQRVMHIADACAASFHRQAASPEDVLWALAVAESSGTGRVALKRLGLDIATCVGQIQPLTASKPCGTANVLEKAHFQAKAMGHRHVGTEHLVLSLLTCGECAAASYLLKQGLTTETLLAAVKEVRGD